jgi:predicted nucleic acid-binding protein
MTLIDSNVLFDVLTRTPDWWQWSLEQLEQAALNGPLVINDVVYAEVSTRYPSVDVVDSILRDLGVDLVAMPRAALFLAGKAYLSYRTAGGVRTGVLSDFFIGAHAAVEHLPLLTRDIRRYRSYFPTVNLIAPQAEQ